MNLFASTHTFLPLGLKCIGTLLSKLHIICIKQSNKICYKYKHISWRFYKIKTIIVFLVKKVQIKAWYWWYLSSVMAFSFNFPLLSFSAVTNPFLPNVLMIFPPLPISDTQISSQEKFSDWLFICNDLECFQFLWIWFIP